MAFLGGVALRLIRWAYATPSKWVDLSLSAAFITLCLGGQFVHIPWYSPAWYVEASQYGPFLMWLLAALFWAFQAAFSLLLVFFPALLILGVMRRRGSGHIRASQLSVKAQSVL
jgi:hypothetical protein